MRIVSWNVNGLRACHTKGFLEALIASDAEIFGIQEVRSTLDELPDALRAPGRFTTHFHAAARRGYSGVGLFARRTWDLAESRFGVEEFDVEGRVHELRFGRVTVVNAYFPNGNGKERDNSRVPYKIAFSRHLRERLAPRVAAGEPIFVMGDFNTAHEEIDLARPRQNRETSGFLAEEREELSRFLAAGFVDTFRHFEPAGGHYSWWSQRFGVRARNIGWRLDYVLASEGAMRFVRHARIHPEILGSDHCPVSVDVDPAIFG